MAKSLETLKPCSLLLALIAVPCSNALGAEDRVVISDDGREVLLKADGRWEFRSEDRFANTADGQRIRLRVDGRWEYIGNAPLATEEQVRTRLLDIKLQQVVAETHEKKVQKNTRASSQTVFYLNLEVSPRANSDITLNNKDISLIQVIDNKGRVYPVLSVQPATVTMKPDSRHALVVRVDGAPQWWKNVKTMKISFHPDMFGIQEAISLSRNVDDIQKKKVDGFDKDT